MDKSSKNKRYYNERNVEDEKFVIVDQKLTTLLFNSIKIFRRLRNLMLEYFFDTSEIDDFF
jgi:hypothetical protein